jgi:hypothetical protein
MTIKDVNLDALFEIIVNPDEYLVNYLYCDYLNFSTTFIDFRFFIKFSYFNRLLRDFVTVLDKIVTKGSNLVRYLQNKIQNMKKCVDIGTIL